MENKNNSNDFADQDANVQHEMQNELGGNTTSRDTSIQNAPSKQNCLEDMDGSKLSEPLSASLGRASFRKKTVQPAQSLPRKCDCL